MENSSSGKTLLFYGPHAEHWLSLVTQRFPEVRGYAGSSLESAREAPSTTQALIGWGFPADLFEHLTDLEWIQVATVGIEQLAPPVVASDVVITNTRGLYDDAVSEYVVWALLTLNKRLHKVMRNQLWRRWRQVAGRGLRGQTIGILGTGSIGRAVSARLKPFGARTVGIIRPASTGPEPGHFDEIETTNGLSGTLPRLDALVLCLPLTPATRGLISRDHLALMQPDSILVNVSRGGIVRDADILDAVDTGRIAGAALDVFEKEPLRRWHRMWRSKNLLITPHLAGLTPHYRDDVGDLICRNVERFLQGQPLINEVDKTKGY